MNLFSQPFECVFLRSLRPTFLFAGGASAKSSLLLGNRFAVLLMDWPISHMTLTRTIMCLVASSTAQHLAAIDLLTGGALRIDTPSQLCNGLYFFVLFIQTFAGNPLSQIFYQFVFVRGIQLTNSLLPILIASIRRILVKVIRKSSMISSTLDITR